MRKASGGKFTSSHTSLIQVAEKTVFGLADLDCVNKISLGIIKPINNGAFSIKCMEEGPGCLLLKIRGPRSIQEVRIYTNDKDRVLANLALV
jgi:hypothetical protein